MATFGNTAAPTAYGNLGDSGVIALRFQLTEDGTVTQISAYLEHAGAGANCKLAIYSDKAGPFPDALQVGSNDLFVTAAGLYNFAVNKSLAAGYYWLAAFLGDADSFIGTIVGAPTPYYKVLAYGAWPDTYPADAAAADPQVLCIYATYTPAAAAKPLVTHVRIL